MKPILILLALLPSIAQTQTNLLIDPSDPNRGVLLYTGPESMLGTLAPEFSATTFEGKSFSNDNLKGKITIINFWMISCPPCIAEIPGLNNIVAKYGYEKFNYIAIGKDDEDDIKDFLKKNPWTFDQLSSGESLIFDVFKMTWGYPTTFVLDQEGVIIAAFSGGKTDERAVQEIEDTLSSIITLTEK